MKKLLSLLALTSLLVAGSAFALMDDGTSSLGVYFDEGTFDVNVYTPTPVTAFNMYFVMAHCEFQAIGGFEFAWRLDPTPATAPIIISTTLPPQALNIGDNYNLIVGIGTPYFTGDACVLAVFNMMFLTDIPATSIQVGPADPASIPGHCAFNDAFNVSDIRPMNFSTVDGVNVIVDPDGWVVPGVGGFPTAPIATENTSWGGVKALFE